MDEMQRPVPIDTRLGRVTGEFVDRDLEATYARESYRHNARRWSTLAWTVCVWLVAFSLVDLSSLGFGGDWVGLLVVRVAAASLVATVATRMRTHPESLYSGGGRALLLLSEVGVVAMFLVVASARPDDAVTSALSAVVVMLVLVVLVPGRFLDQAAIGVLLPAGLVVVAQRWIDDGVLAFVPLLANLLAGLAFAAITRSLLNRENRTQWAATRREREASDRLATELVVAAALRSELQTLARQDALTGVANRREFLRVATSAVSPPRTDTPGSGGDERRQPVPQSMLMLDVDRFKSINDTYGHAVGDAVLVGLARALQDAVRDGDVVARTGGEEFAVLVPGLDGRAAAAVAERCRTAVAGMDLPAGPTTAVTVSVGVAEQRRGDTAESLMARADAAMYRAKRGGGDAVAVADPVPPDAVDPVDARR